MEPVVSCQATFENIPADSLTPSQVAEVAYSLDQAIALYVGNTTMIATSIVAINTNYSLVASPSPSRRHLLQTGNTLQSTVTFTATFAAVPTTATDVGSGSWNVTIVFPANNQVSTRLAFLRA